MNKKILYIVVGAVVIVLVYYLFFSKKAPASKFVGGVILSEAEAKEISKTIANLIETENPDNLKKAEQLKNDLLASGWSYVDWNAVTRV